MSLVRPLLIVLVLAAPASAVTTTMSDDVAGGFAPRTDGGRTAYGFLAFGTEAGAYQVIEHPTGGGRYEGTFSLFLDRHPLYGTTTLVPSDPAFGPGYRRTWTVDSNDLNCQSATGQLVSTSDYYPGPTFQERLEGSFDCAIGGSSFPGPAVNTRFTARLDVTSYDTTDSVIGRISGGPMDYPFGIILLRCLRGDGRCSFEFFDIRGSLYGSFPVRLSHHAGKVSYRPGRGSTQVGGHGDPEYRRVRATSGWKLRGTLDKHHRGTLTLTGRVFR
jgi:hypothetical protein